MKRNIILFFSMFFVSITTLGQIKGTVKDSRSGQPLEFVNVILMSSQDSSFVAGSTTDNEGHFVINKEEPKGFLKASFIGYKTKIINLPDTISTILLDRDEVMLDEVTVKAKKYIHTAQGIVVNTSNSAYSRLGYASDMLKHLPFVSQKNGEYTILGKGTPIIYVNNRQLRDNEELEQINSADIRQVKIITNPGAEYDATVNAVIKIFTSKKEKTFGGLFDAGISQERKTAHFGGLSMNFGKGDFDFFASLRYNRDMSLAKQTSTLAYNNRICDESLEMNGKSLSLKGILGVNIQHDDILSAGIRYQYSRVPQSRYKTKDSLYAYNGNVLNNLIASNDNRRTQSNRHYVNGYASYNFTKDTYLKFDADYLNTESNTSQDYAASDGTVGTKSLSHNNLYAGRLTFCTPLIGGVIKTGAEFSYTVNKNSYKVLDTSTMQNELQTTWNTEKQMGLSYFVQYERNFGECWNGRVGGRFEHIDFNYFVNGDKSDASRINRGLYPSASVSYNADDLQITLAYRTTTRRPNYFMLRSAVEYNNPYYYEGGTPDLKSQNNNTLSLSLSWKDLQFTANYTFAKEGTIYVLDMYNESDSIALFHTKNIGKIRIFNVGIVYTPTWFKIWKPTFSIDMTKPYITYNAKSYNKPIFYFEFNNLLELPHNFILGCDMNYNTAGNDDSDLAYQYSDFGFDAYCIKTFLRNRLRLKLSISNVFNTSREKWHKDTNGITLNKWCDRGQRTITFSISYRINKINNKYKGEHSTEEIYRL